MGRWDKQLFVWKVKKRNGREVWEFGEDGRERHRWDKLPQSVMVEVHLCGEKVLDFWFNVETGVFYRNGVQILKGLGAPIHLWQWKDAHTDFDPFTGKSSGNVIDGFNIGYAYVDQKLELRAAILSLRSEGPSIVETRVVDTEGKIPVLAEVMSE